MSIKKLKKEYLVSNKLKICIHSAFGFEGVLKKELIRLGYSNFKIEDGRISFDGDELAVARCNIFLRTAERVSLEIFNGKCADFDTLFDMVEQVKWEKYFSKDSKINVYVKSKKSQLASVPTLQGMIKKGIIKRLSPVFDIERLPESGSPIRVDADFTKDILTLTLDTSGDSLHKRGYRIKTGDAPMKETLAAGIILLSNWNFKFPLYDVFCGSGTIPIEAAYIALNKAPGLDRHFAAMKYPCFSKKIWKEAGEEALENERNHTQAKIYASDIDPKMIEIAKKNAIEAEVDDFIIFESSDFRKVTFIKEGVIISNPPYGERLEDEEVVAKISQDLAHIVRLNSLSLNIFSGDLKFIESYGIKPKKNRKLYNGKLKCYLYHY